MQLLGKEGGKTPVAPHKTPDCRGKKPPKESKPEENREEQSRTRALEPAWGQYCEMRKDRGKPLVSNALPLALAKLEELAPGNIEGQKRILEQSVFLGWLGLYNVKPGGRKEAAKDAANPFLQEDI